MLVISAPRRVFRRSLRAREITGRPRDDRQSRARRFRCWRAVYHRARRQVPRLYQRARFDGLCRPLGPQDDLGRREGPAASHLVRRHAGYELHCAPACRERSRTHGQEGAHASANRQRLDDLVRRPDKRRSVCGCGRGRTRSCRAPLAGPHRRHERDAVSGPHDADVGGCASPNGRFPIKTCIQICPKSCAGSRATARSRAER